MTEGTLDLLAAAARWFHFIGGFLVIGATVQRWAVLPVAGRATPDLRAVCNSLLRHRAARVGFLGAVTLLAAGVARLWIQGRTFAGPDKPVTFEFLRFVLFETTWGQGWLTQAVAAGMAGVAFALAWAHGRLGWPLVLISATAVAFAAPLTGHAVGSAEAGLLGYPLDLLHFLAGGAWIGTLIVIAATALWAMNPGNGDRYKLVAALIHGFSPVALVAGVTAMTAGTILAWRYLDGSLASLVGSRYGQVLLLKIAALAGVAGVGAYNSCVIRPRLAGGTATTAIGRSTAIEIVLSLLVLAITTVLVSLPMAGDAP